MWSWEQNTGPSRPKPDVESSWAGFGLLWIVWSISFLPITEWLHFRKQETWLNYSILSCKCHKEMILHLTKWTTICQHTRKQKLILFVPKWHLKIYHAWHLNVSVVEDGITSPGTKKRPPQYQNVPDTLTSHHVTHHEPHSQENYKWKTPPSVTRR